MASSHSLLLLLLQSLIVTVLGIWPEPVAFEPGESVLWLSADFEILFSCQNISYSSNASCSHRLYVSFSDFSRYLYSQFLSGRNNQSAAYGPLFEEGILRSAISRTQGAIFSSKFVPWKFHPRRASFEPVPTDSKTFISRLQVNQESQGTNFDAAAFFAADESYTISISADGQAIATSNSTLGSIRALQTFEQLFYAHSSGCGPYTPYAPLEINDYPTWPHRGLNLDISRNYFAPRDVLRTIDAMASAKMSRLHIHATDAQSWPIEVPSLPGLAAAGAYQSTLVWSPGDLAQVQTYGLERGISVFVEIDMPGHSASIANAYPELITAFNESDWSTFAAEPPTGQLRLNSSEVYDFLRTLFADILPRVSPFTSLFHNGGDEVNVNAFLLDETIRSNSSTILQPLVQNLMSYITGLVSSAGMRSIVWEEMLLDWNLTLQPAAQFQNEPNSISTDTIIQVWRSSDNLLRVLQKGYRAIFGDYTHWYLDCGHGGFINPYPSGFSPPGIPYNTSGGIPTQIHDPFTDYCDPLKNWRHIYVYDPLANITSDLQPLIEGGEVHMWTEQTDPVDLDQKVWPRAAAAAEVLWSGPRNASMIEDASKRLGEWRERIVERGVGAGVVQMDWCLMEGNCNL